MVPNLHEMIIYMKIILKLYYAKIILTNLQQEYPKDVFIIWSARIWNTCERVDFPPLLPVKSNTLDALLSTVLIIKDTTLFFILYYVHISQIADTTAKLDNPETRRSNTFQLLCNFRTFIVNY